MNLRSFLRASGALILIGLLGACAGESTRDCAALAGPSWVQMREPPANAASLLAIEGLPNDTDALWFSSGSGKKVLACIYARGLTSPGCGGATVYQFEQQQDRWVHRGMAMDACEQ